MVGTLLQAAATPMAAADGQGGRHVTAADKPVAGHTLKVKPRKVMKGPRVPQAAPRAHWPKPASETVTLPEPSGEKTTRQVKASKLPLTLRAPSSVGKTSASASAVKATMASRAAARKAGVDGLLFTLQPDGTADAAADTSIGLSLDYSAFAEAFGGDYGSRLRLVELPSCALTTPDKQRCRSTSPVGSANDTERQALTAGRVPLRGGQTTVLAATADEDSSKSDYKATSLSPSATWSTDLNTGDFTWSYDMPTPSVPGEFAPKVALDYSSGTIDGRTSNTNNQSSWIGDGFDLSPGFIERRYKSCADDDVKNADGSKPGDECWAYDNAYLTFNGKGGELVPAGKDEWKLRQDDGTRVTHKASTDRGNGDKDGEYWILTTPEGIRYYFGYNRLPGWSDGKKTTDSTWTVPVFGDDSDEPCHADTFADSWCQQAWRWNLDYAVDTHGNAIAYYYNQEENSYGRNLKASDDTRYTRGGYLDHIEYGLRSDAVYSSEPLAKVNFHSSERCLPKDESDTSCSSITSDASAWYDTPWDLNCDEGKDCDNGRLSPSFWTRKRLTSVTTQVRTGPGAYSDVDSWEMNHRWDMADTDYQFLLDSIQHTGKSATPTVTLPKTTFGYKQLANRLDKTEDGYAPFIKDRLSTVADEYGGQIDVNYYDAECDWDKLPTPETNTTRCFPQFIGGDSTDDPERQWFNKYVVKSVTATDRTGGAPDEVTSYEYPDHEAAWHFDDDDGLTKEKFKTWSQWRGYGHVRVKTGGQGEDTAMLSQQDSYFLRGMDGDRKTTSASGGTKSVSVTLGSGEGDAITDDESSAGFTYKTVSYSGPGGKVLAKTVNRPWHHQTASKTRDWGTVTANFTGTAETRTWTSLDDGAGAKWRTTVTSTSYDTVAGRPTQVDDRGDTTTADDNRCTRTTYAVNTIDTKADVNILTLPSRVETVAVACDATPDRTKDVVSDVRTAYDSLDYDAAPTKGEAWATATLKKNDGTTATYLESGTTFDDTYGRTLATTDLTATVTVTGSGSPVRTPRSDGRTTTEAYAPDSGFATTVTEKTPPADPGDTNTVQTTTTTLDPLRGQPTVVTDTNGNKTKTTYDALGRTHEIWLANHTGWSTQLPTYQYNYQVAENKPVAVVTRTLAGGGQAASYTIYDGFLRPRETQSPGPDGGLELTDTFYDERGLTAKEWASYYRTDATPGEVFPPQKAVNLETQTWHSYDGLGREILSKQVAGSGDGGPVLATTKTIYGGDRTTVIPPDGGTATTTLVDARNQTTELRQLHQRDPDAAYDTTRYTYTNQGKQHTVTDPAGNTWTYTYDQLGRQTIADDPDEGITTSTYDDRGQLISTKDARDTTLVHVYDGLGRQTELHQDSATGPLRAKWTYDTVSGAKGQLAESTRYDNGNAYTYKVTSYDRLYRAVRTAVVIPEAEGDLAGTYQAGIAYRFDGVVDGVSYSEAGGLPGGQYTYTRDDDTLWPKAVTGDGFSTSISYTPTGKPQQYAFGASSDTPTTDITNTYEYGTQRLHNVRVDRLNVPGVDKDTTYTYDEAGNIRSAADVSATGTDNQCYTYDYLARLTEAWTEADTTCATTPTGSDIGGPAPYWQSYGYDLTGNRLSETDHDPAGAAGGDTERTYTYPQPGSPQPHTLTSVTTTTPTQTSEDTYTYDEIGNTKTRTVAGDDQKLTWDAEGHLAKVTEPATDGSGNKETDYLYDADGNRLIARTPTSTTLYLSSGEITLANDAGSTPKTTRYIPLGGGHQAVQQDDGSITLTVADHQGTGQLAISTDAQSMTQRRTLPFGATRATQPSAWPGTKSFVGGTDDTATTGLTHLGAREYDPATGRFISVDPLIDPTDPQQMNGYAYAGNNPVTDADPSGKSVMCGSDGGLCGGSSGHGKPSPPTSKGSGAGGGRSTSVADHLLELGPQTNDKDALKRWWYGYASGTVQGKDYWDTQVGDGHRLSMACYGRDGCIAAYNYLLKTGNVAHAKKIAATYCLDHAAKCAQSAAMTEVIGETLDEAYWLILGGLGGGSYGCKCFLAGTDVLMADGSTKDIEDIKTGDKVLATDPETGKTVPRKVTQLIVTNGDKYFNRLSIATQAGVEKLTATHEHPFWSPSERRWVTAGTLKPGMTLRTPHGETAIVTGNHAYTSHATTYNLTVDDLHTYYVLAGETPVLVHNSGCWTASDDVLDHVYDTYGPEVTQGVEYNIARYNEGATGHALNGIGTDSVATAQYLAQPRNFTHVDSSTGNPVYYDSSNKILVIRTPQDIHAYNFTEQQWKNAVGTKYVEP
ncbi:polymorphic toxin-type HINT domain-containing protein [Streptomyces odontomachi]|uniref:polymorphic toxin-type HINT domain-containing protein n=1 Tax=Streptomyces odontomachi TaxID=2944940 RepID=UPI00210D3A56|nr:polymorphic toxin-type HINT domain-containing protein [Streptomyces sp. ODS25]